MIRKTIIYQGFFLRQLFKIWDFAESLLMEFCTKNLHLILLKLVYKFPNLITKN